MPLTNLIGWGAQPRRLLFSAPRAEGFTRRTILSQRISKLVCASNRFRVWREARQTAPGVGALPQIF